ncbi:MAG: hypothetical protein R2733_22180 [Acidimicrobiales bacterium]
MHQWRQVTIALVAIVGVFGWTTAAGAATDLTVTTPADGHYQPGATTPLLVTIAADGAVEGTLRVSFDGQASASQYVEVPGGSEKQVVVMVGTLPWTTSASVTFDADGKDNDKTVRANITGPNGDEIVGVLPELAGRELPATADLTVDIGQARLFPFDVALLDYGPDVLSPFSQILATPGDLEALTSDQLESLEGWLGSGGGELVVDAPVGTPLVVPIGDATSERVAYGIGSVTFTGGSAALGGFDDVFAPTTPRSADDFPWGGFFGGFPTSIMLARDAGVKIPAIGSLALGLLAYTIVVGPVMWFLLRRRRSEPGMWLAVPGLAVVTAVGVWAVGLQLREGANTAHTTVIADLPTSRQVLSHVLVTSANGGLEGIELPDGWRSISTNEENWGGPVAVAAVPIQRDGAVLTELDPGGIGVLAAETTEPAGPPAFAIDVRPDGNELVGTVTNLTAFDLSEVLVSSGQGVANVGSLDAGASKDIKISGLNRSPFNGDPLMERMMQNDPWSANDGVSNPGVLISWLSLRPGIRSPGLVMASGWTRDAPGPVRTEGGSIVEAGRTAFVSVVPLETSGVSSLTNQVTYLRGYNGSRVSDVPAGGVCTDFPLTYAVRPGDTIGADETAVIEINRRSVAAFDVWDGGEWVPGQMASIEEADPVIGLPASASTDGVVYLRVQMTCDMWSVSEPLPELRLATGDDDIIPLGHTSTEANG